MTLKSNLSLLALIAANFVPLIGALFFNWDAVLVLALFWIENLIIGAFNVAKLLTIGAVKREFKSFFLCAFFVFHYGAFCSVHGVILWDILGLDEIDKTLYFASESMGVLELFSEGAVVFFAFIDKFQPQIYLGIAALCLSHLVSFLENFILQGGVFKTEPRDLMAKPYAQILILHAGLIFGAAAVEKFGSPIWLLLIILVFKLVVDIVLFRRRRRKEQMSLTNPNIKAQQSS